jgi:hypothetical protein
MKLGKFRSNEAIGLGASAIQYTHLVRALLGLESPLLVPANHQEHKPVSSSCNQIADLIEVKQIAPAKNARSRTGRNEH